MSPHRTPLYVAADIHGHRTEFRAVLRAAGLADENGHWSGGRARLWLLGDHVDRGPDGIGVIEDVRRLAAQARDEGGQVGALLGNHEVQLLAAHRFGTAPVPGWDQPGGFHGGWARFGGQEADLRGLTPSHLEWLAALPAAALVDGHLLVHSDTTRYLELGTSVAAVNAAATAVLADEHPEAWLEFSRLMSSRGSFRGARAGRPDEPVARILDALGGSVLVHGHSTLTEYFGIPPERVRAALRYAGGRVLAIDGGAYLGGRILLTRLR
ncbi:MULTISPECIES: metallophosphoesterase [Kitasatospora]|uniref:Putative serine/threonine protein phosphatase n=1 Tax=Kitasatospora setae (strain ATCC 33774 / DSM 43861 / JCM 3304 / KCC A-0304 / NBRC 14216 / KM-6054) TaxID=452652 RepID=E4N448_KITSK|nr:metallophosphoesterase [Kitasatospora setae]BAJ25979.1 putative serine/threonine protein phosphatase [Kitasatospora setae KM-6054]